MEHFASRVQHKGKKGKKSEENRQGDVKDVLSRKSIGQPGKKKCEQDSAGQYGPYFDKGNRLNPRIGGGDNDRILISAKEIVIEGDQEKHEQHGNNFFYFPAVHWPKK